MIADAVVLLQRRYQEMPRAVNLNDPAEALQFRWEHAKVVLRSFRGRVSNIKRGHRRKGARSGKISATERAPNGAAVEWSVNGSRLHRFLFLCAFALAPAGAFFFNLT